MLADVASVGELLLPLACAGCGHAGVRLCSACKVKLSTPPHRVFANVDPMVPVYALGEYAGPHRLVVLGMKERGRTDMAAPMGAVLRAALEFLSAKGEISPLGELLLVPAPTKKTAARARGGDPVQRVCQRTGLAWQHCLQHSEHVRDSVGLDAAQRRRNQVRAVQLLSVPPAQTPVIVVDDVLTTGATLEASVARLTAAGANVIGAVVFCAA